MPRPYRVIERVETPEGPLELRQAGERQFMITIDGRVLMTSLLQRSEIAVAELGTAAIRDRPAPRVLIGGLGLGFTLRAALDALPRTAHVEIAELNPAVERWCRGPLAGLTNHAIADPRVAVFIGDVTDRIRAGASGPRYDAIVLDLYVGPGKLPRGRVDPLYGPAILKTTYAALHAGGVYAVWAEEPNPAFAERLRGVGFRVELVHARQGGPRHAVYVATKTAGSRAPSRSRRS